MKEERAIHPDFQFYLKYKDQPLIDLYEGLRTFVWSQYPDANELLYHTHALTSLYTVSEKMSDAFCLIPIYTKHLNLGFMRGTLLADPHKLLKGTGKLMRHIPITKEEDYNNNKVLHLIQAAIALALDDLDTKTVLTGSTISKIKKT